jgi:hypothetical protein
MKNGNLVAVVTFAVFSFESFVHYNVAKNEDKDEFKFYIPKLETTLQNLAVVGVFAVINGLVVTQLKKM